MFQLLCGIPSKGGLGTYPTWQLLVCWLDSDMNLLHSKAVFVALLLVIVKYRDTDQLRNFTICYTVE